MERTIDFTQLESSISNLNDVFEENTAKAINRNITARNWLIGFYIVNYEQNGRDRAKPYDLGLILTEAEHFHDVLVPPSSSVIIKAQSSS